MKILFSDNTLWGLMNFRGEVVRHFHERGDEVVLVAPDDRDLRMGGHLPEYVRHIPVTMRRTGHNPFSDLRYMVSLLRIYRRERPDWIFHYTIKPNIYGTLAARLLHRRSVVMVAGLGYAFSGGGLANRLARSLYSVALRLAHRVFVLNAHNRDTLLRLGMARADRVILLEGGEGVNTRLIPAVPDAPQQAETIFLMVARLLYDKGYAEFVEAARQLRNKGVKARFRILGPVDESYPNAVSRQQFEDDVREGVVEYCGFTSEPLKEMGTSGTAVVLPSYHEGMSRSLMEAIALGRPVITTDIPGCREMVREGVNGYLVPPKDADSLAAAMERYAALSPEAKKRMGHASRALAVERFDVGHVIDVYEQIVGGTA